MKRIILLLLILGWVVFSFQGCDNGTTPEESNQPPIPSEAVTPEASPLVAQGHYFRDAKGGVVFLRGVNVAGNSKVPPFKALASASELQELPSLGVNTVRLLFNWEAFEPVKGEYSNDYLAYYRSVVDWARHLNLYVIVDFHQDAYSRYALDGCGEGFPKWAVTPEVNSATPNNGSSCSSWGVQMLMNQPLKTTWSHFHTDKYGAKSAYLNMVERVVQEMMSHENVIGYELINEPWGTDAELFSLFSQVATRIRRCDPNAILFVPAHALVSGGTREDTINMPNFKNMVYSPHYYDGSALLLKNWLGNSPSGQLDKLRSKAETWSVPMLLSEFGAPAGTTNGLGYIKAQLDWLDQYWISSTQWNYTPGWRRDVKDGWNMEDLSIVDDKGTLRDNYIVRPYPQRIAGAPKRFTLNDRGFILAWTNRADYGATTVFIPKGYADNRRLTLVLPNGGSGACSVKNFALVCDIQGAGDAEISLAR